MFRRPGGRHAPCHPAAGRIRNQRRGPADRRGGGKGGGGGWARPGSDPRCRSRSGTADLDQRKGQNVSGTPARLTPGTLQSPPPAGRDMSAGFPQGGSGAGGRRRGGRPRAGRAAARPRAGRSAEKRSEAPGDRAPRSPPPRTGPCRLGEEGGGGGLASAAPNARRGACRRPCLEPLAGGCGGPALDEVVYRLRRLARRERLVGGKVDAELDVAVLPGL